MERRVLFAVVLSFVVLYAYQALFIPPRPPSQAGRQATQPPGPAQPPAAQAVAPADRADAAPRPEPASAVVGDTMEREIIVETSTVLATLSNRGGRIVRWQLKQYRDERGEPVDLVPSMLPPDQPTPLLLRVEDDAVTERLNTALYRVSGDTGGRVNAETSEATIVFEFEDVAGLHARKELRFDPRNYLIAFSADVTQGGRRLNPTVLWGPGLGDIGAVSGGGSFFTGNYIQPPQAIYHRDGDVERIAAANLGERPSHEGQFRFAGIDDHYFLATAVNPGKARLEFRPVALPGPGDTQRQFVAQSITFAEPPEVIRFFFGPKQFDLLRSIDAELVRAINFGIFGFLAVPLLGALQWIYGYIGNWGWAIVLLTIAINVAIFPLRHKSVVSMRKMQALQPQLKAIQDRYKDLKVTDPTRQKMNTEIMNLYREKGVNPASGCVPMVLQFPVLLAFYSMLSQSIELRGAEFALWIHDLSRPDPYFIIPILMAVTMFWQTKITPSTADPAQQRVMLIMPLMFTVFFLWAPSGLVVYWFVSNLWAIGQQYFTTWLIGPATTPAMRPPAERRLKKIGAGRTSGAEKS
ncbi:MAG: membrane protein insertase YidC [Acidobacteria bacterium]|nr:membrane protein insertase YidC [Acidobacteriota bacterium]